VDRLGCRRDQRPFFFQAFTIYPDGPAALLVL
jgi:hypothetical protein